MEHLYLEDLKGLSEEEIKSHLIENYAGDKSGFDYGEPTEDEKKKLAEILAGLDVVVAYESVGSWGCDSSSFFLFRRKSDGIYLENHGSHCSCYGFEGQFSPEETTKEYLKSEKFNFSCGGYDDHETDNQIAVKKFLAEL